MRGTNQHLNYLRKITEICSKFKFQNFPEEEREVMLLIYILFPFSCHSVDTKIHPAVITLSF